MVHAAWIPGRARDDMSGTDGKSASSCHCGPDPQSMNPHGRVVLRGAAFEVLHNRFWAVGDRAGSLKVLGTELARLEVLRTELVRFA